MAELTAYSELAELLRPDVPGAEPGVLLYYLRRAGRKFCADSEVFQRDITATLVADEDTYALALADHEVRRLVRVRFLDPAEDEAKNYFDGREIHPDQYDLVFDETDRHQIRFSRNAVPNSDEAGFTLVARVVLVPHQGTEVLPDDFLTRWQDAIRFYTLFDMMSMEGRPWSSAMGASRYLGEYQDAVARGRFEVTHENKSVTKRMVAPSFI